MTRFVLGMVAIVGGLSGCSSPARYVERTGDSGVVAIPANTDSWPNYNRREAMALIQKHVGGAYEIVEEREVATGQKTFNDQQVNNEQTWNSANPLLPANRQTVQNTTTTQDVNEYRIAYRRKATPYNSPISAQPAPVGAGPMGPLSPAGATVQTQYMPGTGAGVRSAGGMLPAAGPTAPIIPAVGPPPGGSGVYGSAGLNIGQLR